MITFADGPAHGATLELQRSPIFLRVVIDESDGKVDALDQLDDTPGPSERVHVYQRESFGGTVHVCSRGRGGGCRTYPTAEYRHLPDVDGEQLRDTAVWREWADTEGAQRAGAIT